MPTLDWLNRDAAFRVADLVPYRLLRPVSAHGDGDPGNLLVQGDNLEALKALLPLYRGRVKCIFIDPPYNTRSAFEHYDDNLEHSQWLAMMLPRLQLLREFLREDGSIWVTIDDNEGHYLKVLMDEVFGRGNFVANVVWQKAYTANQTAKHLSDTHDHLLVFAKDSDALGLGKLARTEEQVASFKNPDNDPRGPWKAENLSAGKFYSAGQFPIAGPTGEVFLPPVNRYWRCNESQFEAWRQDGRITFGLKGTGRPMLKKYLAEAIDGLTPTTWWRHEDSGSNKEASIALKTLLEGQEEIFQTPKPEKLCARLLQLATDPGDLILDSFLGSGTTAAVAHKMGRRWIGIEMGEHAVTHCLPRLEKVIAGEPGGISAAVGWQGGGGFRFMQLGEPVFDARGVLNPAVGFGALAAHVWQQETRSAYAPPLPGAVPGTPLIGVHEGRSVHLLYNGILGDRRPAGGNLLTLAVLQALKAVDPSPGPKVVYGEACRLGAARLEAERIVFRQIPYDLGGAVTEPPLPAPLWTQAASGLPRLPVEWLNGMLGEAVECPWIEFKSNLAEPEEIARYVSALANGAALSGQPHGYLVWGVDDASRAWTGTTFRPELAHKGNEDLRFWLSVCFRGQVEPEFLEVVGADRRAIVLRVPAAVGRPVVYAGEAWGRVQSSRVRLRDFPDHERGLRERLDRTRFEQGVAREGCAAADVLAALDTEAFFAACGDPVPPQTGERLHKLADWGCLVQRLDGRWNILNLGALLLARDLAGFSALARKALRVVLYRGSDASAPSDELPLGERGYVLVVDEAVRALAARLPADERVQGAQRQRREHFPGLSLRELIVNALVHQDFAVRGAGPLVEVFEDRVVVTNPGRPLVAVDRLLDWPAQSRNEALARAMRMLKFCEERGSGIDRVVAQAEAAFLPAPVFELLPGAGGGADFMRVRLPGPQPFARIGHEDRLRAVYQDACLLYQRGERLTNASLRARFGLEASQVAQISRLIAAARSQGIIRAADDAERAYVPAWVGRVGAGPAEVTG